MERIPNKFVGLSEQFGRKLFKKFTNVLNSSCTKETREKNRSKNSEGNCCSNSVQNFPKEITEQSFKGVAFNKEEISKFSKKKFRANSKEIYDHISGLFFLIF